MINFYLKLLEEINPWVAIHLIKDRAQVHQTIKIGHRIVIMVYNTTLIKGRKYEGYAYDK